MKNLFLTLTFVFVVNLGFANEKIVINNETSLLQTIELSYSIDSLQILNIKDNYINYLNILELFCTVEVEVKVGFPPFWGAKVTVKDIPCDKVGETIQQVKKSLKKK